MSPTLLIVSLIAAAVPDISGGLARGQPNAAVQWAASASNAAPPSAQGLQPSTPADAPLSWESLDARVEAEAKAGFEGVVLVVREGKEAVHRAFGKANREKGIAHTTETIFAIGSTPIDFTKAAILRLVQEGKLKLEDPISRFLPDAPKDRSAITLAQLLTGRSGLPDFVDQIGDRDPDHAWIDRDEFLKRVFAAPLLFAPGSGREHSHAAFGVLAAVIEIASGESYQQFTSSRLFAPAGMNDTGFFGAPIPEARLAIGYGMRRDGEINAPPAWGRTSWLVMGSGGMTSTVPDMRRWFAAIRRPDFLDQSLASRYLPRGEMLAGGDMYGFEILMTESVTDSPSDPTSLMIIVTNASNSPERRRSFQRFGEAVGGLVLGRAGPTSFTIGIMLDMSDEGVVAAEVLPEGAAAAAGVEAGDRLLTLNGLDLAPNPGGVLAKTLTDGKPVTLVIERRGERKSFTITPKRRS
ncbi:MAG: beta-lactamase family protein [Phycisphaerae bacterium]|jgi:CubicO group peptidase (beta-lactamase class C family)|nr:beta-lactamase family protein [Phycisphaerae bacterium]